MSKTARNPHSPYSVVVASFCVESVSQYHFIFSHTSPKFKDHTATLGHRDFTTDKCGKRAHTH